MGEVYLAVETKLKRPVAFKTLRKEFFTDPERHRRFIQEARAASALDHPNIVTIYDIAEHEGLHFIVMQYVAGESLGALIRDRRLELPQALEYAVQIADGLARAHRDGIVHRDLKPDNVMVSEEGRAKIVDFGLAKLTEPLRGEAASGESPTRDMRRPLTGEGEILGTGAYMSPEQALGKDIDARSDIFSFGSVLYEMVTGEQAFSGENIVSVLASVMRDEPEQVSELVPAVPAGLESVIGRALRKDGEQRYQSMEELREALLEVKEGRTGKPAQVSRLGRKLGVGMAAAALVALVAVELATFFRTGGFAGADATNQTSHQLRRRGVRSSAVARRCPGRFHVGWRKAGRRTSTLSQNDRGDRHDPAHRRCWGRYPTRVVAGREANRLPSGNELGDSPRDLLPTGRRRHSSAQKTPGWGVATLT